MQSLIKVQSNSLDYCQASNYFTKLFLKLATEYQKTNMMLMLKSSKTGHYY